VKYDGLVVALFPAALNPADSACVVSHPGVTYGGLVHQGKLRGEKMLNVISLLSEYYAAQGLTRLIYKAVPSIYHHAPAQDDLYGLFRLGARRSRCDLSSTIDLDNRLPVSERRRRCLKKTAKAGVRIITGHNYLPELWHIVAENLQRKHRAEPAHTVDELRLLTRRFPNLIECVCASVDGRVEAGTLLFRTPVCDHAQYIAASERGYEVCALDAVFEYCIEAARKEHKRWFDFGISTEDDGRALNNGLYRFKSEFGAGGTLYEFYELNL
jgi:hypothetical protein